MTTFESFKVIEEFPDYMVSNFGQVYNVRYNRWMTLSPTEAGDMTVGLNKDGVQHRRSVKVLVAMAFVEGRDAICDTAIQLDRDKTNLRADNLVWRPRWFAWRYARQFEHPPGWAYSGPVQIVRTGEEFPSIIDAAFDLGVLMMEIRWSLLNQKRVFPYGYVFKYKY